jgi:hypothetical protein
MRQELEGVITLLGIGCWKNSNKQLLLYECVFVLVVFVLFVMKLGIFELCIQTCTTRVSVVI